MVYNLNEANVSVTMKYTDLKKMMEECVITTLEKVTDEQKKAKEQKWLNTKDTADMFGVDTSTINRWKRTGYLKFKTVGRKDFFNIEEIKERMTA